MNQDQTAKTPAGTEREPPSGLPLAKPTKVGSPRVVGCSRWASFGCLGGLAVLVLFLFASFWVTSSGALKGVYES